MYHAFESLGTRPSLRKSFPVPFTSNFTVSLSAELPPDLLVSLKSLNRFSALLSLLPNEKFTPKKLKELRNLKLKKPKNQAPRPPCPGIKSWPETSEHEKDLFLQKSRKSRRWEGKKQIANRWAIFSPVAFLCRLSLNLEIRFLKRKY